MKNLLYIVATVTALCSAMSCAKKHSPNSVKAEAQAIDAASRIAAVDSTDTAAMQAELLKAEAMRSQYVLSGDSDAVQNFDDTFRESLIQKSPRMAKTLFSKSE